MDNDLNIYARGSAFEGGIYDLRSLELLLSSYRSILDRLVAVHLGRRQLNESIKNQINYDVKIKEGSVELLLDFVLEHKEILAVASSDGSYQLSVILVKLYRDAIKLRKAASKFIDKGIPFEIKIINSFNFGSNNVYQSIENSEILIPDSKILWAAQATRYPTDKLLGKVDGKEIEYVDLNSNEDSFRLNEDDRIILGKEKEVLNAKLKIVGRLDMIAFTSHKGAIISDGETFPVTWDEDIRSNMHRIADKENIEFTVKPVIDHKG